MAGPTDFHRTCTEHLNELNWKQKKLEALAESLETNTVDVK